MKMLPHFTLRGSLRRIPALVWAAFLGAGAPAAGASVAFTEDVWPILEDHCLKCHGDVRPKGGYRLTSRENALNSGDWGENIVVGSAEESPLIEFVERIEPEYAMPPDSEDNPLSPDEVAILRAWIDEGLEWEIVRAERAEFTLRTLWRGFSVDGSSSKFREATGLWDGDSVGLAEMSLLRDIGTDATIAVETSVWEDPHRYDVSVRYDRLDWGFVDLGAESFRTYDNRWGEYAPNLGVSAFRLGRDLERDFQHAWIELGLRRPNVPQLTVGYDYYGVDGRKSLLQHGVYAENVAGAYTARAIRPSYKEQDHDRHVLTLALEHEWKGVWFEDVAKLEWVDLDTTRVSESSFSPGMVLPEERTLIRDDFEYTQTSNTIRFEKHAKPWLFLSGGHLYTNVNGDAAFSQTATSPTGAFGPFDGPIGQRLVIDQHSQVINANASLGPWRGASLTAGFQGEWMRQDGEGMIFPFAGATPERARSRFDEFRAEQRLIARYDRIPNTALYLEGGFAQENSELLEDQAASLTRDTDSNLRSNEAVAGLEYSPKSWLSVNLKGRRRARFNDFEHDTDVVFGASPSPGYPGFLLERNERLDEFKTRVAMRPARRVGASVSYGYEDRDYRNRTDAEAFTGSPGGSLLAAAQKAHVVGASLTYNPLARLALHSFASYWNTRIEAESQGSPSVVPFRGDVYSITSGLTYSLDPKSDVSLSYSISEASYGQDNAATTVPAGTEFRWRQLRSKLNRRFSPSLLAGVEYAYFDYRDPAAGTFYDFDGHGVFVTMEWRWR